MKFAFLFLLFTLPALAAIETELSGNAEVQGRHAWNNEQARQDFFQNWKEEDFYLGYGNVNGKAKFENSTIEGNIFARHSKSDLYKKDFVAVNFYNFPLKLVARDLFRLQHFNQTDTTRDEVVLNKMYYQWESEKLRAMAGRLYINYGLGEIFNPLNPFNQPTALTAISQVAQGNDGGGLTLFLSDKHKLDFYVLGDKSLHAYNGDISWTFWAHGELQLSSDLEVDYVLGRDQERNKGGTQVSYQWNDNLLFFQGLYQTPTMNNESSKNRLDLLFGYDRQLTGQWHVRVESGYQKKDPTLTTLTLTDRFLPSEYFIAVANQYELNLWKYALTIINDVKTGFTYGLARITYNLVENAEAEIFAYSPVAKGGKADIPTQKLVTQDLGAALRYFF
ncbi:MAG: hypothetical protein ACJ76H_15855 [Bacteriovoracaceae bacterium]